MNSKLLTANVLNLVIALFLVSCTTPTISNRIEIKPIERSLITESKGLSNIRLFGGGGADWIEDLICIEDGSCTIFGSTIKSFGESTDFLVVKTLKDNSVSWAKTLGGPHGESLHSVIRSSDDGFVLVGSSHSLFFTPLPGFREQERPVVIKTTKDCEVEWAFVFESGISGFFSVDQAKDGSFLLAGYKRIWLEKEKTLLNTAVVKLTASGKIDWAYMYGANTDRVGRNVSVMSHGNIIVTGDAQNPNGKKELFIMNLDKSGRLIRSKSLSSEYSMIPGTSSSAIGQNIYIYGTLIKDSDASDAYVAKINENGNVNWIKMYKNRVKKQPLSIVKGFNNNHVLVGRIGDVEKNKQNGMAIIINDEGELISSAIIGGKQNDDLRAISQHLHGEYILGFSTMNFGSKNVGILTANWKPDVKINSVQTDFGESDLPFVENKNSANRQSFEYRAVDISKANNLEIRSLTLNEILN